MFSLSLLTILLASASLGRSLNHSNGALPSCFPYGSATLPKDLSVPDVALEDWWCAQSLAYGFQGFSYPLEDEDCAAYSNSFESMDADFAQMKRDFGASIVRMYYPICLEASVFENALRAGVANDMAVIFQVWTDFGESDDWKKSQQAIYDVLESSEFGPIAPYVVHSADFGSEPITDGMDGGGQQFVNDLTSFRSKMNSYGIPAGISEEWDRPGDMSSDDGTQLGDIGAAVKANSDYCHAHIMPFYHDDMPVSQTWSYIEGQMEWIRANSRPDVGVAQYTQYWEKYDEMCETFKELNVGWFLHTWRGEGTFDIVYENGSYVIPDWRPREC
ncbi:glycoside hydrolase family 17 protein [Xylariomycetidae sp. FL2044]|nr:glycoside hydrolase family 17 protein [Xylariomycetidae sp. FL2044]